MNILTNNGWEDVDWEVGYPFPDIEDGVTCILQANDFIPNINEDDLQDILHLVEKPVNDSLRDNEESNPSDNWRLCGFMFQKTSWVDKDPENTSLGGESVELNVVNGCSPDEDKSDYPHLFRGFIPLSQVREMMDAFGATGGPEIPIEQMTMLEEMGIGLSFETVVDGQTFEFPLDASEVSDEDE